MNLLESTWLPFLTRSGELRYDSPVAIVDPEIVDVKLPRADFKGAAYQLLIGLLQTALPPEGHEEWGDFFREPPAKEEWKAQLSRFTPAFELDGEGPRFMQDLDTLEGIKPSSVAGLLIDSPGENGIKQNIDFFIKRGRIEQLEPAAAALALFTLQSNAPSGGAGHRVGLRGGGPLTTLVLPEQPNASLWHKLWLNVLPIEHFQQWVTPVADNPSIFPWMGPTLTSEKKQEVLPDQVHPLHAYWSMPRRIRLEIEDTAGQCDISGRESDRLIKTYRTKNYGANYGGPWQHPFTPYKNDPAKPNELPLSLKPQPDGLGYRHWSNWVFGDQSNGFEAAAVINDYIEGKFFEISDTNFIASRNARLWAFGYDMDNMKPRCWYSTEMPVIAGLGSEHLDTLRNWSRRFIELASWAAWGARTYIKNAWFERSQDAGGDTGFIATEFFDATQAAFFEAIQQSQQAVIRDDAEAAKKEIFEFWYRHVCRCALSLFDYHVLTISDEGGASRQLERGINARKSLNAMLLGRGKGVKDVKKFIDFGGFEVPSRHREETA